jgi:hypothetical protein
MSSGNGHLLNAVNAGDETSRLIWNALFVEHGAPQFVMSKAEWAARWRPHPNLVEAVRNFSRRKKGEGE